MQIDTLKYPQTLEECWKLIQRLDKEITKEKMKRKDYGIAAGILRDPRNFQFIDDVIEKSLNSPFTFTDFFNRWLKIIDIEDDKKTTKILSDLKAYTKDLLIKNGIIRKVGGNGKNTLYRPKLNYDYVLRNSNVLSWRDKGQDEGTFLVPKRVP